MLLKYTVLENTSIQSKASLYLGSIKLKNHTQLLKKAWEKRQLKK